MSIAANDLALRPCRKAGTFALLELVPQSSGGGDGMRDQIASSMRIGAMGTAGPAVIGGALLLVYKVAMSLFVGFGPLFILFAGFKSTMQLFTKWLYYGIGTMFSMAVLSFMVALVAKITLAVALGMLVKYAILMLTESGAEGINAIAMQQGGVGLIMTILLISCPPMAAMFFNATVGQFSAYSQFGVERGGGQRDAAENLVVGNGAVFV